MKLLALAFVSVVVTSACHRFRDAAEADAEANRINQASDRTFAARLEQERAKLGPVRFEPSAQYLDKPSFEPTVEGARRA